MLLLRRKRKPIVASALSLWLVAGCQQPTSTESANGNGHGHSHGHDHPHDHHSRPTTLTAAVSQLDEIRDEVKAAMESGAPDDAHGPLHEVGELLEALPEIAADTNLPREKWEEVKAETDKLFDAFGVIDGAFHQADGDKQGAYKQVADEIDTSIASLEALLPLTGESVAEADHDHDHDDHDHGHDDDHDDHDH